MSHKEPDFRLNRIQFEWESSDSASDWAFDSYAGLSRNAPRQSAINLISNARAWAYAIYSQCLGVPSARFYKFTSEDTWDWANPWDPDAIDDWRFGLEFQDEVGDLLAASVILLRARAVEHYLEVGAGRQIDIEEENILASFADRQSASIISLAEAYYQAKFEFDGKLVPSFREGQRRVEVQRNLGIRSAERRRATLDEWALPIAAGCRAEDPTVSSSRIASVLADEAQARDAAGVDTPGPQSERAYFAHVSRWEAKGAIAKRKRL